MARRSACRRCLAEIHVETAPSGPKWFDASGVSTCIATPNGLGRHTPEPVELSYPPDWDEDAFNLEAYYTSDLDFWAPDWEFV